MRVTKRITKEQKAILRTFKCQRLTAYPANRTLVRRFFSQNGASLTGTLQGSAWNEDLSGVNAYYVIKTQDDDILLFFSLKCGVLFNPNYFKKVREEFEEAEALFFAYSRHTGPDWALQYIRELRESGRLDFRVQKEIITRYRMLKDIYQDLNTEIAREQNQKIVRVDETHAGIELVHFCANDWTRNKWKSYGFDRSMGEVLFWYFVVPKILQAHRYLGCEYVYLFAADLSEDNRLINYYTNSLNFTRPEDIGASKPYYDFWCTFMCQRLTDLKAGREEFIRTFNRLQTNETV